jgi:hypothetical protein
MIDKETLGSKHGEFLNPLRGNKEFTREIRIKLHQGLPTLECDTYRALIRAVGFYHYRCRGKVLLRGQVFPSTNMVPNAYRNLEPSEVGESDSMLDAFCETYRGTLGVDAEDFQSYTTEPVLQHYGIRTRWLDVVDSVPHALFFATHEYMHSPFNKPNGAIMTYLPGIADWGYIYLLEFLDLALTRDTKGKEASGVWWSSDRAKVCDLRMARPSNTLRPHMQHGLLCRPAHGSTDLSRHIVARIAVPLSAALSWIGGSRALARETFFPPPIWDNIYGTLLTKKAQSVMSRFKDQYAVAAKRLGDIARYDFIEYPKTAVVAVNHPA